VNLETYCRDIEAYLCRKNDGHLIRIAGPAFERVSRWAEEGIPLKVACAGIDRYFERYYRKGPRRRPVRIEFCEADVLDAFDDWRRAVGVAQEQPQEPARSRVTLSSHLERVIARLTSLRASSQVARPLEPVLERVARELDHLQPQAKSARGAAREALLGQISALDRDLLDAALNAASETVRAQAQSEAREQLAAFRERMAPDAYQRACATAVERHVRDHFGLPTLTFS
jgi:hypothetical protein